MSAGDSNVSFNLSGTQQGVINMAGRDMHVAGQTNVAADADTLLRELKSLRDGLGSAGLPRHVQQAAEAELQEAEQELTKSEPDAHAVADRMTQFATIVKSFGGLAGAGALLVEPLGRLAHHLGPLGQTLQRLLS